jgi:hypothetical protein
MDNIARYFYLIFVKENRLLDYIFVVIKDFEEKNWQKYPVHLFKNWEKIKERHN